MKGKFSDYLTGRHFRVLTDNNPLAHILTSPKLDATGQRWAAVLGEYNFEILYRPGYLNVDADKLSRYPYEKVVEDNKEKVKLDNFTIRAICSPIYVNSNPYFECLPMMNLNLIDLTEDPSTPMAQVEMRELRQEQIKDPIIGKWRNAVIDKKIIQKNLSPVDLTMKRNFKNFVMKRSLMFRETELNEEKIQQLVVPTCYRQDILRGLHTDIGHPGIERTTKLIRQRFFWPGILTDVENYVKKCERCLRRKSDQNMRAPLINVHTTYPLELVCFDFLTLETSKGGYGNILVITDHFTKFAMAIPTKN